MTDSIYDRVVGGQSVKSNNDLNINDFIGLLSEYAVGTEGYNFRHIVNSLTFISRTFRNRLENPIVKPLGSVAQNELKTLLKAIDAKVTISEKQLLVQEWRYVFLLAQNGRDYRTKRAFNKRLGLG